MSRKLTDYEAFESSSIRNRRLLRQEELILEITEALIEALENEGISKTDLASKLGKSKGFVSQILAGGRNLTLRTIADVADSLGCRINVICEKIRQKEAETIIAISDYKREAPRWMMPDPIVIKVSPSGKKELARAPVDSWVEAAA
jgi:transcriptional regulator with XRE-family HTH domain